jgi:hypothetical protein
MRDFLPVGLAAELALRPFFHANRDVGARPGQLTPIFI